MILRAFLVLLIVATVSPVALCQEKEWDPGEAILRARMLVDAGKLRQGLALFLQIREKAPHFRPFEVQREICRLYERLGDIPKALKEYETLINDYPWARERIQILMRMAAMAEVALHDLDRAWGYLEEIPEDKVPSTDMAPYLFNKGYLLEKMGKPQDALRLYERLIKEYPDTVGAFWAKERVEELSREKPGAQENGE